jgi:hypothetical protein
VTDHNHHQIKARKRKQGTGAGTGTAATSRAHLCQRNMFLLTVVVELLWRVSQMGRREIEESEDRKQTKSQIRGSASGSRPSLPRVRSEKASLPPQFRHVACLSLRMVHGPRSERSTSSQDEATEGTQTVQGGRSMSVSRAMVQISRRLLAWSCHEDIG